MHSHTPGFLDYVGTIVLAEDPLHTKEVFYGIQEFYLQNSQHYNEILVK